MKIIIKTVVMISAVGLAFAMLTRGLEADEPVTEKKLLRHVVLFEYNDEATAAQIDEIAAAFAALPGKIDAIVDFEWGSNNSPEGLSNGLTHCFLVSFASEEGRAQYLPHPAHQEFVAMLKPVLKRAVVVDYWPQ